LQDALEVMRANNDPAVGKIFDQTYKLLQPLEASGAAASLATQKNAFTLWITANPPKKDSLFEGVKDATVKPANRQEDEAPEK
jgi:hypothetical protein